MILKQTKLNQPRFVIGPPGTGKTHIWILQKYLELYRKYGADKIILLSHTKVAKNELKKAIQELEEIKNNSVIQENENYFDYRISTIHAYCKKGGNKSVFDKKDDWPALCQAAPFLLLKKSAQITKDPMKYHPFFKCNSEAHGRGMKIIDHWNSSVDPHESYKPYNLKHMLRIKQIYEDFKNKRDTRTNLKRNLQDYCDMIDAFNRNPSDPEIDALIVDEAQDSSVPQLRALEKMARNVKDGNVYYVGDPNQTIFTFAGSNPDYFEKLSVTNKYKELETGLRCSVAINNYCKAIIVPVWRQYGYTRTWTPTEIEGNVYNLPNLIGSPGLNELIDKIKTSKESFLFTYRTEASKNWIIPFLEKNGFKYSHLGNNQHVSDAEINCHYTWPLFLKGETQSFDQLQSYWTHLKKENKLKDSRIFKKIRKKDYTFQEFVNLGYLDESLKDKEDFYQLVKIPKEEERRKKHDQRMIYIKTIINKYNLNQKSTIELGNFHQVKGLTRDNVIVDLTLTRAEPYFEQLYLYYVACSRGKHDLWILKTQKRRELGKKDEYIHQTNWR